LAERKEKKAQLPIGIKFENLPLHYPAAHRYKKKKKKWATGSKTREEGVAVEREQNCGSGRFSDWW